MSLFSELLFKQGFLVLDGVLEGLATQLEKEGEDISGLLWSAKLLQTNPSLIKKVHIDYLNSGADIITTASYQATFDGFKKAGYSEEEAEACIKKSVSIAIDARDEFLHSIKDKNSNKITPMIAGSAGCYGAWLANGAEFTGDYELKKDEFKNFHRKRVEILLKSGVDLIAFETFPQLAEAEAVIELLSEFPDSRAWISFSCRDEKNISHGESFSEVVELANKSSQIVAVGINCTAPKFVSSLLRSVPESNKKPFIVYPNSGEIWTQNNIWKGTPEQKPIHSYVNEWFQLGAKIIGGCCRTTPEDINNIRKQLENLNK